ncbi:MAG: recombination-associated protein RdgC [Tepidimonas sp.]|uniref:recombination-associated protein RdgC n=1 Tax=Tepidimonas sp. TaxID=2002775 RepID=UPI00298EF6F5|nr:recombination-associated protein RdgC [Tepidimonas sp.]MDW8336325.1 recombination-associated protein RdgC [Tepidimonas sp.]
MFKNLTVLRVAEAGPDDLAAVDQALRRTPFVPCGPTQAESRGWVPPRDEAHAPLVESLGGQRLMRFRLETKRVPAAVVRRELQARCAHIEATEGRQPGRREQRELKEAIVQALLPQAFASRADVWVWHDVRAQRLLLDTTTARRVDAVTTALVEALPGWRLEPPATQLSPATAMANWLASPPEDWPPHLAPGREVELRGDGDSPPVVRLLRHVLQTDAMREHLQQGKRPTRLALDWDGRVQFVLTESLQLRRITLDDGVFEANDQGEVDRFDADALIITGELSSLLDDLIAALGGWSHPSSPA